jgi:sulfate permease, SulP family
LKLARQHNFSLVLTNLLPELAFELKRGLGLNLDAEHCQVFADIDRGLDWCEQQILAAATPLAIPPEPVRLVDQLTQLFLTADQARRFVAYLTAQTVPADHYIFRPGEIDGGLYFIESGQVTVLLEQANGRSKRLQTCTSGHLLGEMRFYGKAPLSTAVVTDVPSQLYHLPKESFSRMQQEAPDLAQALQAHIVTILCDSLLRREQQLKVMQ